MFTFLDATGQKKIGIKIGKKPSHKTTSQHTKKKKKVQHKKKKKEKPNVNIL